MTVQGQGATQNYLKKSQFIANNNGGFFISTIILINKKKRSEVR